MMSWDARLYQLQQQIAWQTGKIVELESMIKELMNQVEKLGTVPQMKIDKIEYTFDQLKVEKLEGALHIGISPPGTKDLLNQWQNGSKEAFDVHWSDEAGAAGGSPNGNGGDNSGISGATGTAVDAGMTTAPSATSGFYKPNEGGQVRASGSTPMADAEPYRSVDRFMAEDVPPLIEQYANAYRLSLDSAYRDQMARSLHDQIGDRVNYYLSTAQGPLDPAGLADLEQIVEKVKRDVATAIHQHMEQMQRAAAEEEEQDDESSGGE
ncbi:spore germination protein GerPC [Gorillibacterium timonense]|uniref:spore germination protein GerPC n=1 Tax=Gorillibacterium timonense TaxID=1689269 RepID=UPI00131C7FE2|nr:spore germination protein GerPC [Gorillibacterium timonense]